MKILYYCHNCGDFIDELDVENFDEKKLGFDHLTEEEKRDIMEWNKTGDILYVGAVCDTCYQGLMKTYDTKTEVNREDRYTGEYITPRIH